MRLFRRRPPEVTRADLGMETPLRLVTVDGELSQSLPWTKDQRRVLALVQPTLAVLRAAGLRGDVDLRTSPLDGCADGEVRHAAGGVLRFVVDVTGAVHLVTERDESVHDVIGYLDTLDLPQPVPAERALDAVVFATSSLVAHEGGYPVALPEPLSVTTANLQRLEASGDLPARWCACVFVTRAHDVPDDADEAAREDLWIEHTVGVKLHLDGTIASDPLDDDPDGERSRTSLATAAEWAGEPVDLVPYARWLADQTQERIGVRVPGL